jgi:porin
MAAALRLGGPVVLAATAAGTPGVAAVSSAALPSLALPATPAAGTALATAAPSHLDAAAASAPAAAVEIAQAGVPPAAAASPTAAPAPTADLPAWPSLDQMLGLPSWMNLQLQLTAQPMANPIGGLTAAASWLQQIQLTTTMGSALGVSPSNWKGEIDHWQTSLSFTAYSGNQGFGRSIGSIIAPQSISLPVGVWFSGASLTRRNKDGNLQLSAGLLSMDQDFLVSPAYNSYLFSSINNTLNLNILGLPISPFIAPGGTVRWQTGSFGEWRLGAYWLNPETQLSSLFGVDTGLPTLTGNLQALHWTYQTPASQAYYSAPIPLAAGGTAARQLPAPMVQLGAFRSSVDSGSTNNFYFPQALPAPGSLAVNRVTYASLTLPLPLPLGVDNRVWAATQIGFDPANNPTPFFLAGGWLCQGPVRGRPLDVLALGVARSGFSGPLLPGFSWQAVVELNYTFALNSSLSLQPVVQWIFNPSSFGAVPGILTTGLQLTLNF